mmetsp:Transcript_100326/g.323760  ORF Transcript_100326/g.323760 Transcript_100326/m.323760 type:complete len:210 (-) Transcript_100326:957-1586(-)
MERSAVTLGMSRGSTAYKSAVARRCGSCAVNGRKNAKTAATARTGRRSMQRISRSQPAAPHAARPSARAPPPWLWLEPSSESSREDLLGRHQGSPPPASERSPESSASSPRPQQPAPRGPASTPPASSSSEGSSATFTAMQASVETPRMRPALLRFCSGTAVAPKKAMAMSRPLMRMVWPVWRTRTSTFCSSGRPRERFSQNLVSMKRL